MATTVTAPVGNSISLASKYLPILDEIYKRESLTRMLDTAKSRVNWIGAQTANIFTTNPVGLANYDRNAGFVPGDVVQVQLYRPTSHFGGQQLILELTIDEATG